MGNAAYHPDSVAGNRFSVTAYPKVVAYHPMIVADNSITPRFTKRFLATNIQTPQTV